MSHRQSFEWALGPRFQVKFCPGVAEELRQREQAALCGREAMTKHSRTSRQAFRRAPAVLMAWILLSALPAFAARIVQVRVGNHPEFTRVVFELDGPAGYRVERRGGDQPEVREPHRPKHPSVE